MIGDNQFYGSLLSGDCVLSNPLPLSPTIIWNIHIHPAASCPTAGKIRENWFLTQSENWLTDKFVEMTHQDTFYTM